jgi:hypothetical protein
VLLLVMLFGSGDNLYSWSKETVHTHQKAIYLDPTFFSLRGVLIFGAMTAFMLWFVYRSVRLDVGVMPEQGAGWARGIRDGMRRGFGDERRELHSAHSLLGKLAVVVCLLFGWGWPVLGVGLLDDLLAPLPVDDVRLAGVHGRVARHAHAVQHRHAPLARPPRSRPASSARATSTTWASSASRSPRSGATSRSASSS